ncbi:MAG: hypothetical protein RLZZ297_549 [Chloroflexota bacterium]|jgi:hypothetical protein
MQYNEYKYVIELDRVPYAVALLESMYGNTDPYAHGTVNSLYYDTLAMAFFQQCTTGNEIKSKYRVRWYDGGLYQAQIKEKDLYGIGKVKAKLGLPVGTPISALPQFWHDLPFGEGDAAAQTILARARRIGPLFPVAHVRYHRRRYRSFDFRMNIDTNIEVRSNPLHPVGVVTEVRIPLAVLEIKTKQDRPILPFLAALSLRQDSFSKYGLGMQLVFREADALNKYLVVPGVQ